MKDFLRKIKKNGKERIKFVILSRYRSGSNLLKDSLNSIENVRVYNEAFNLVNISKDPETYLDRNYVDKVLSHTPGKPLFASGFKLMYGQALAEELSFDYWGGNVNERIAKQIETIICWLKRKNLPLNSFEHLIDQVCMDKDIRVVHLIRKNQLDSYLSYQLALQQDNWKGAKYNLGGSGKLRIHPEDLLKYFLKGETYYKYYSDLFKGHRVMEVYYNDLSANYARTLKKIARFLSIPHRQVPRRQPIEKQNIHSPDLLIENYDELSYYFKNSTWEEYFTINHNS